MRLHIVLFGAVFAGVLSWSSLSTEPEQPRHIQWRSTGHLQHPGISSSLLIFDRERKHNAKRDPAVVSARLEEARQSMDSVSFPLQMKSLAEVGTHSRMTGHSRATSSQVLMGGTALYPSQLSFKDRTFRFLMFNDMHFGESLDKDRKSMHFQRELIQFEKPDLVVIGGDASSDYSRPSCGADVRACEIRHQEYFRRNWDNFTAAMHDSNTPYAYALGNHDRISINSGSKNSINSVSDHSIMEHDERSPLAVGVDGPPEIDGASNYVVPIYGHGEQPLFYIWVLDSGKNTCLGKSSWGCVEPNQIEWFRKKSAEQLQQNGRVVPGMAIVHIPLPEMLDVWKFGSDVKGTRGELIGCPSINTGLFAAMVEAGNIQAVFSGHDHANDFAGWMDGILLAYGGKSGYGGCENWIGLPRSRVVVLHLEDEGAVTWETYMRLENGDRKEQTPAPSQLWRYFTTHKACGDEDPSRRDLVVLVIAYSSVLVCFAVLLWRLLPVSKCMSKSCSMP